MWNWLQQNYGVLSAVTSLFTLFVWILYFEVLFSRYRHGMRPKILINRGAGQTIDARCIVANMSAEAIYIEAVILALEPQADEPRDGLRLACSLSDLDTTRSDDGDPRRDWFQGPLGSGELIDLGSYRSLVEMVRSQKNGPFDGLGSIRVTVAASYTAEDRLIAAERTFDIAFEEGSGQTVLRPRTLSARQVRSRRRRRQIERLMTQTLRQEGSGTRHRIVEAAN